MKVLFRTSFIRLSSLLMLIVLLSAALVACGDNTPTPATTTTQAASSDTGSTAAGGIPPVSGTPVKTADGLQYIDIKVGTGPEAKNGSKVQVHYTGYLTNGQKFDSSYDRGQPFPLTLPGNVIQGWNEGLVGMKQGGKRRLIIPPALGYGAQGYPPVIPGNSQLIFDVELVSVS
ncbi:MAG TPA: FKBP-type peptidyl-prolyl cis-trans isomerase [Chloroflexia bacterium]|nr:FKBP-type peptidyl-prolyl cis-trans isomerase [Chloroflexia bacterium]